MANLAIKGHANRGKEVIEILEMLGGMMKGKILGTETFCSYYIDSDGSIDYKHYSRFNDAIQFTLEEFLEKFPYKVGDKVLNVQGTVMPCQIKGMYWDNDRVKYYCEGTIRKRECFDRTAEELQPYKEQETKKVSTEFFDRYCKKCGSQRCTAEGEWLKECKHYKEQETMEDQIKIEIPKGYEFACVDGDNQQVVFEKIGYHYPKTYEECCKILDWNHRDYDRVGYNSELLCKLQVLLLCRDAYWKIAGEQMGLGKPWEPLDAKDKYIIRRAGDAIVKGYNISCVLEFPTEEMRDVFYENFKDLIEQCKKLL